MIAGVLLVMVGLLSYIYYLHTQRRAPTPDLASLAPLYEAEIFTAPLTEKDAYQAAKAEELRRAGREETEVSVSELGAEARKLLNGLLMRRAIAAVDRAVKISSELENVRALQTAGLLSPASVADIQAGIRAVEAEHVDVRAEADVLRHQWGAVILAQAHDMTVGLEQRKQTRRQQEEEDRSLSTDEERRRKQEQRAEEEAKQRQARLAEQTYRRLLEEEERRKKRTADSKKDKKDGDADKDSKSKSR